jgi:hypothetical protein
MLKIKVVEYSLKNVIRWLPVEVGFVLEVVQNIGPF